MLTTGMPLVRLEVPHEEGEWIDVRQLGWAELDECRNEVTRRFFENLKTIGSDVVREFTALQQSDPAAIEAARAQADSGVDQFDKALLLAKSVTAWSYQPGFSVDLLPQLDERTTDWLYRAIVALYTDSGESEDERGEGFTPSTVT